MNRQTHSGDFKDLDQILPATPVGICVQFQIIICNKVFRQIKQLATAYFTGVHNLFCGHIRTKEFYVVQNVCFNIVKINLGFPALSGPELLTAGPALGGNLQTGRGRRIGSSQILTNSELG